MSKELRDGLFLDNSVFIADEKKPGFPIPARIIQVFAILIGGWSSISVLLEGIPVPAKVLSIDLAILLCAAVVYALCLIPSYDMVKVFFGVLFYSLFFYSRLPILKNGFYIMENVVLDRLASYYNYRTSEYLADYANAGRDTTLLMIMITIPIVSLLVVAIVRSRFVNITAIVLFLPVILNFLFGLIPSEKYLVAYLAAILYLTRSGFTSGNIAGEEQKNIIHRINSRAAVWLSLLSILLFFVMKLFISEEKYDSISQINQMKTDIQTTLFNYSLEDLTHSITHLELPKVNLPGGGLEGGKLGRNGKVEYTESEQLKVIAPLQDISSGFYLKGYVGSVYTGDKWVGHSDKIDQLYKDLQKKISTEEFSPINQMNQLIAISGESGIISKQNTDSMTIEYRAANKKFLYTPYFTDYELIDDVKYKQDLYAAPGKKGDTYAFEFYNPQKLNSSGIISLLNNGSVDLSNINTPQLAEYSKNEKLYRDFVYQAYTLLPDKGLEQLKQQCETELQKNPGLSIYEKIYYVMNYLNDNTRYTLSPGDLPKGKDFVEYFLYENKKGYCAHYASAAALMLRALGVPTRYVEGYAVSPSDVTHNTVSVSAKDTFNDQSNSSDLEAEISVKDYNAHAWVEIYFDDYGWFPLDFTPASSLAYSPLNDAAVEALASATPTPIPPSPTPVINRPQKNEPKPETAKPQTAASGSEVAKEQHKLDALFLVLFILAAAASAAVAVSLLLLKKKKLKNTGNHNKRAIYLFARIEKMLFTIRGLGKKGARLEDSEEFVKENCLFIDTQTFTSFMETVRKARYGRGRITLEELKLVEAFHQSLYEKIYSRLPALKRLYLRIVLFL